MLARAVRAEARPQNRLHAGGPQRLPCVTRRSMRPGRTTGRLLPTVGRTARFWRKLPNAGAYVFGEDELGDILEDHRFVSVRTKNFGTMSMGARQTRRLTPDDIDEPAGKNVLHRRVALVQPHHRGVPRGVSVAGSGRRLEAPAEISWLGMNSRMCRNAQRTFCHCCQFDTSTRTSVGGGQPPGPPDHCHRSSGLAGARSSLHRPSEA